jgi:nitroreductase
MLHELIAGRWSPRTFADRPVEPEKLASIFEAARRAASCFNEQPWRFVWAPREEKELFAGLAESLVEKNRDWADKAPVLFLSVAARYFANGGKENRHARHDVGLAMGNLTLQAASVGLMVHQMAGFDAARARENLNIPDEFEPVAMVAVGYPEPQNPPEGRREKRPLAESVFHGSWGKDIRLPV